MQGEGDIVFMFITISTGNLWRDSLAMFEGIRIGVHERSVAVPEAPGCSYPRVGAREEISDAPHVDWCKSDGSTQTPMRWVSAFSLDSSCHMLTVHLSGALCFMISFRHLGTTSEDNDKEEACVNSNPGPRQSSYGCFALWMSIAITQFQLILHLLEYIINL